MAVTIESENVLAVTMTVNGDGRSKGYVSFHIGEAGGVLPDPGQPDFIAYLRELADNVEGISHCQVSKISVARSFRIGGNAAFGVSPEVERKGVFVFENSNGKSALVTVPGLDPEAKAEDGINILRTGDTFTGTISADLQGFHDKMRNGVTIGAVTYPVTDRNGFDFGPLKDAYQQSRRASRG